MTRAVRWHGGQATVETLIAAIVVVFGFLALFRLSHMLTGRILLEHAAMRAARARSVGFNGFMCRKSARVAAIPVCGRRLWPEGDEFDYEMERSRIPIYMATPTPAVARGALDYEGWGRLAIDEGDGRGASVSLANDWFDLKGRAEVEDNCSLYLDDYGL